MARRVLILHSSAGLYGADAQLLTIARGLDRERWSATCVLPERGPLAERLEAAGAEVVIHPLAVVRRSLMNPAGALALRRASRVDREALTPLARDAALVHSNTSVVLSGGALGRPHLVHVREIWPRIPLAWPLMRRRLLKADALACISQAVCEQFGRSPKARLLADGLERVPQPPPRVEARTRLGVPQDAFVAAFIGRLSTWKGQDIFARALVKAPGVFGVVAGDELPGSGQAAALERLAKRLKIEDRMLCLGFTEQIDAVLGAADVLVVPSKRPEPLGLVALEAVAAGVPVVASAAGGVAEIVREANGGALVRPGDPKALATALRTLAEQPVQTGPLPERFTAEAMLASLQELYDDLAG